MILINIIALILGILRILFITVPIPDFWFQCYKDVAHLFIGGIVASLFHQYQDYKVLIFWGLVTIEICASIVTHF